MKPLWKEKTFRSPDKLDFIRQLPCIDCGWPGPGNEAHHIETGGMGIKCGDELTVPLCGPGRRGCHRKADKTPDNVERFRPIAEKLHEIWKMTQEQK